MANVRNISGLGEFHYIRIRGQEIPICRVQQLVINLALSRFTYSGYITIQYDLFKEIQDQSVANNGTLVNVKIEIEYKDHKFDQVFKYDGIIIGSQISHSVKSNCVILYFEHENIFYHLRGFHHSTYANNKSTLEIVDLYNQFVTPKNLQNKKIFKDIGMAVSNQIKRYGTMWESFSAPVTDPPLPYILKELSSDGVYYAIVPDYTDTKSLKLFAFYYNEIPDMFNDLSSDYTRIFNEYTVKKFGNVYARAIDIDEFYEVGYFYGKQAATQAPWSVMNLCTSAQNTTAPYCFFRTVTTDGKDPYVISFDSLVDNSIWTPNTENTLTMAAPPTGEQIRQTHLYSDAGAFANVESVNGMVPNISFDYKTATQNSDNITYAVPTNTIYSHKYYFNRIRASYDSQAKRQEIDLMVAGSIFGFVPGTFIQCVYHSNSINENDDWDLARMAMQNSGIFMITSSSLIFSGNNIMMKLHGISPRMMAVTDQKSQSSSIVKFKDPWPENWN